MRPLSPTCISALVLWSVVAGAQTVTPTPPADVNATLGLVDSAVVTLDVPTEIGAGAVISVPGGESGYTLDLRPHSVRGQNFTAIEVAGTSQTTIAPPELVTCRGTVLEEEGSVVVGGILHDGLWVQIVLPDDSRLCVEPLHGRVPGHAAGQYVVYRAEDVVPGGTCAVATGSIGPPTNFLGGGGCSGNLCLAEIACDADYEFFLFQGASSSRTIQRMELVINTVALQYERDVRITYQLGTMVVRTNAADPYSLTDPDDLLNQFRSEWNTNFTSTVRDTVHLFTGKDLDGSTIGNAYVGQVCDLDWAYGLSQSDFSNNFANTTDLTAHELGHNWDADHCSCGSPSYTMNPGITGANRFRDSGTPNSVADITAWRDAANCLDAENVNNACENAYVVCDGTIAGNNLYATQDASVSCTGTTGADVWYSYTPGASGTATIDTEGSSSLSDTLLAVFNGCSGAELACDDQGGTGNLSSITLSVTAGETYLIRVAGWSGSVGNFLLNIAGPACGAPVNDSCENPIDIGPGEYRGTTRAASNDAEASCASSTSSPDVWYRYEPALSGVLVIDTCDSLFDTSIGVYSGCPATLANELVCDDTSGPCGVQSRIELNVSVGTTYLIRVSGFSGLSGPYVLGISGPAADHDNCFSPIQIEDGTHYGTLQGASNYSEGGCSSTLQPDVFYRYTAPIDGTFFVTTCGTSDLPGVDSGLNTILSIHSSCPTDLTNQIQCDFVPPGTGPLPIDCGGADLGTQEDAATSTPILAGESVYIRVSMPTFADPGEFVLNVGTVPDNDDCASAIDVSAEGTFAGSTASATSDGDTTCGSSTGNPDVWYRYTAACGGTLRVDTCGTNDLGGPAAGIDTVLSLHTMCSGSTLACNDQVVTSADPGRCPAATTSDDSYVEYDLVSGQTVLIRVSTFSSTPSGEFVLNVEFEEVPPPLGSLKNGEFYSGLHWCLIDESTSGSVDYSTGAAVVTGGDAGELDAFTYIEQTFTTYDTVEHAVSFSWSYASNDAADFDRIQWDLIDVDTGLSVVAGPIVLGSANGDSGTEVEHFTGSGTYTLRLGTHTDDGFAGPGISTFDDILIFCSFLGGTFENGDFSDPSGVPWCFQDLSESGSADLSSGAAVVTGGNDGNGVASSTFIAQGFDLPAGPHTISFSWSYASSDTPGFDGVSWDLFNLDTGLSVLGGPVYLADTDGASGVANASFDGPGLFVLYLRTFSSDNFSGPGISTFDDVVIDGTPCDPVTGLSCTVAIQDATLTWTNGDSYSAVEVYRDGVLFDTLPGTATSWIDPALGAWTYVYEVIGVCSGTSAPPASCTVVVDCDGVSGLTCDLVGLDAVLSWTDGDTYTNARIHRDGVQIAILPAGTTSYIDPGLPPGSTPTYEVIGACGQNLGDVATCTVGVSCNPATNLTCSVSGLDATLTWTNPPGTIGIEVLRDGVLVANFPVAITSFTETGLATGTYTYEVVADCGGAPGTPPSCTVSVVCDGVSDLTCAFVGQDATLSWINNASYADIEIFRNGTLVGTFPGVISGFTDTSLPVGTYDYEVVGVCGPGASSTSATCSLSLTCDPVIGLSCSGSTSEAILTWTNASAYDEVRILRDGVEVAVLPGVISGFTETGLATGTYAYQVVGDCGTAQSTGESCTVTVACEGVSGLSCNFVGPDAVLSWTNNESYSDIQILRDGTLVGTFPGVITSFTETGMAPGSYDYEVVGICGPNASSPATCTVSWSCDPVAALMCSVSGSDATLTWTNASGYSDIEVYRDGMLVVTLPGATTSFTDFLLALGTYAYEVVGVCGTAPATGASCTVTVSCAGISGLVCTPSAADVDLSWTNGDTYSDIRVRRGGVQIAMLPGTTNSYTDPALLTGTYDYEIVGMCGQNGAIAAICTVTLDCNPVSSLACSASGSDVSLSWTNDALYTETRISRDGALVATISGSATSYVDLAVPAGSYTYEVEGVCGNFGTPVACGVTVGATAPEFRRGDCSTDGSVNLGDAIYLLGNLFPSGPPNVLLCLDACDANDDDMINLADAIGVLSALFVSGYGPLPAPYPDCGVDPTPGTLDCVTTACP